MFDELGVLENTKPVEKEENIPSPIPQNMTQKISVDDIKSEVERVPGTWDLGLDFEKTKLFLMQRIEEKRIERNRIDVMRQAYASVLYIQLVNGSRVSEAHECFIKWVKTGNREQNVLTRKVPKYNRKLLREETLKLSDGTEFKKKIYEKTPKSKGQLEQINRLMIVPSELAGDLAKFQSKAWKDNVLKISIEAVRSYTRFILKLRTHGLRYAWQTEQNDNGESPLTIATKQGRRTVQSLMNYQQKKDARRKQRLEIQ